MEAIGLLVALEARPGKEANAEAFLKSAQPLALNENGILKWYAIKLGPRKPVTPAHQDIVSFSEERLAPNLGGHQRCSHSTLLDGVSVDPERLQMSSEFAVDSSQGVTSAVIMTLRAAISD
jgi:hypothetical protein